MVIDFAKGRRRMRPGRFGRLAREIEGVLCPGMILPAPLADLFEWIEGNGFYEDEEDGRRTGFLFPRDALHAGWRNNERYGGTDIRFCAQESEDLKYWFGSENPEIRQRLCVFADTGWEGSRGALWLADDGTQKIVHIGSGSGSDMICVLAEEPVDFLPPGHRLRRDLLG